jgi:hypothetical protein
MAKNLRRDNFTEAVRVALGGKPDPDPMDKLKDDLDKLRSRTVELTEGIEKLYAEFGLNH